MVSAAARRFGVIIVGNPRVLSRDHLWSSLLTHYREADVLVEGPLTALKPSLVQLSRPRRAFDRASFGIGPGATNRYTPPERVGEPAPAPAAAAAAAGLDGSLSRAASGKAAGGVPRVPSTPAFVPFGGMYDYSIPGTWGGGGAPGSSGRGADAGNGGGALFGDAGGGALGGYDAGAGYSGGAAVGATGFEIGTFSGANALGGSLFGAIGTAGGGAPSLAAQIGEAINRAGATGS